MTIYRSSKAVSARRINGDEALDVSIATEGEVYKATVIFQKGSSDIVTGTGASFSVSMAADVARAHLQEQLGRVLTNDELAALQEAQQKAIAGKWLL